jgi:hypothetical protein
MKRIIRTKRAFVSVLCFPGLLAWASAQRVNDIGTNPAPTEGTVENPAEVVPPAATNTYGAQPFPVEFETQNNAPIVAGPAGFGYGQIGAPLMGTGALGVPGFISTSGPGVYQAGLLDVHVRLGYSFLYATGLDFQPGEHSDTISHTISPGLTINLGTHWTLDYQAALSYYNSGSGFGDSTSHFVTLRWSTFYDDWDFGMSQSYSFTDTPLVETGTQTAQEGYVTALNVARQLGGNFSFAVGLNQSFRFADQFNDVETWSGNGSLNYTFSPKLRAGLSVGGGYDEVSVGSSITFESYQGVLMFHPGSKTTLNLSGGISVDSFGIAGAPSLVSPIFSATLAYQLLKGTSISLSAARSVSPSYFSNQVDTVTTVGVALQQSLTPKLSLTLTGGYSTSSYDAIEPGPLPQFFLGTATTAPLQVTREDNGTYIGGSLSYAFRPRLNGSVSYWYSRNSSSQGDFSYSSSQISAQLSYQY